MKKFFGGIFWATGGLLILFSCAYLTFFLGMWCLAALFGSLRHGGLSLGDIELNVIPSMISLLTGWRLHRTGKRMVGSRLKSADALKGEGDAQAPSNAEVAMNLLTSAKDKVKNEHGLGAIKDHPVLFAWLYPPAISALVAYWGLEPKSALGLCLGLAMLLLPGILFVAYAGSRDYKSSGGKLAGAIISTAKYVGGMLIFLFIFVSVVECSIHGCNP